MIRISKAERATIYKLYPELRVPRTATGKYWLCEEEKYLRVIPHNKDAAALLDVIDRRRARLAALAEEDNARRLTGSEKKMRASTPTFTVSVTSKSRLALGRT